MYVLCSEQLAIHVRIFPAMSSSTQDGVAMYADRDLSTGIFRVSTGELYRNVMPNCPARISYTVKTSLAVELARSSRQQNIDKARKLDLPLDNIVYN